MMRIAIAGAGGFAYLLASEINKGANALLILSTQPHHEFEQDFLDCQVAVVDYEQIPQLRYALQGVDLVISTICGDAQLHLIDGARQARVRYFVPSEFEGSPSVRPATDPLDRGSAAALEALRRASEQSGSRRMKHTVFSCGILMERFYPGGLGALKMGESHFVQQPGDYLVDIENATAEIAELNEQAQPVYVCMTSVYDVVRFVAAAVEMGPQTWPRELRMRGDVRSVRDIVGLCSNFRDAAFEMQIHTVSQLNSLADDCSEQEDWARWHYYQRLIATARGRYHFREPNLNDMINSHDSIEVPRPMNFPTWLHHFWGGG